MPHDAYASLRIPEYRAFLASMATVSVATQIQSAVLGWQVYAITRDPFSLGLVGLAEALPFLALTLVGGWAADRADRRLLTLVPNRRGRLAEFQLLARHVYLRAG